MAFVRAVLLIVALVACWVALKVEVSAHDAAPPAVAANNPAPSVSPAEIAGG